MTDFALPAYDWRPRKDQMPIWRTMMSDDFRRGTIVAHRRFGKDELALQMMAVKAMQRPGSYWYCLPQYAQARKTIWEMVNWRTKRARVDDAFPPEIVVKRDNQSMMLWLESGSTIQLIGSDQVDSLVGGGQVGIVLSEAALSDPRAMQFFRPILEESGGFELQISTPRGKNHFYRNYLAAKEDMDSGDKTVLAAKLTAEDTSVFPPAQLNRIRLDLIREHGKKIGEAIFEQEYKCSFQAALIGAVWGDEISELELEGRLRPMHHDRRFGVSTSWDLGVGDSTVILFWQEVNTRHRLIDAFEGTGLGLDTYIEVLKNKKAEKGYVYSQHIGPHDIQNREWLRGVSRMDEAKRMGLHFTRMPQTRIKTQISVGAQMLRNVEVNESNPDAVAAFEHWKAYHYPVNKTTGEFVTTPVHDEHSHASSALMTYSLHHASKLGVNLGDMDPDLHGDALGGAGKFDPRVYDTRGAFRGGGIASGVSNPRQGAFG